MSRAEVMPAERPGAVRRAVVHDSAIRHVSGQAIYLDDIPEPPGMLHVVPGLSPIAAGRISRLDLEPVAAAPEVIAVLTAEDVPGESHGPFATGPAIGFHGQLLFAVVARSRRAGMRAARLARIATSPSMPVIDIDDAVAAGAPLGDDTAVKRGDPAMEILRCDRRISGQFQWGGQEHFALEPLGALAVPGEARHLVITAATEEPSAVRWAVAAMLGLPEAAVTVEARRIGGGLGGKGGPAATWAALTALAAWHTGRPCKLRLDREDEVLAIGKRPDYRAEYSAGFGDSGQLRAVEVTLTARCGNASDGADEAIDRALFHVDNAYFYPAVRLKARRFRADTVPALDFRGGGGPEGALVAERLMDHIAHSLGADPLDVRKANLYGHLRDRTPYGMVAEDPVLPGLVAELERTSEYRRRRQEVDRFNQDNPILKRGLALTPTKCGVGRLAPPHAQASALVEVSRDGSLRISLSGVEAGQGLSTKAAQVAAEEFGIGIDRVVIGPTSTAAAAAGGSGGLDGGIMAVIDGCRVIKDRLYDFIEEAMRVDREQAQFEDGMVSLGIRTLSFAELIDAAWAARVPLSAHGSHATPDLEWDHERAVGRPFHYFAYGAACAEVTVDIMTGEKRVDRVDILQDAGRSLNPAIDLGLVEGGFMLGLGWLTSEELVWDSAGRLLTRDGGRYAMPRASDLPRDFRVALFQSSGNREETPYRSKDICDASVMPAVSVFSAIGDAVASIRRGGVMPRLSAPATPEAIMRAIRSVGE